MRALPRVLFALAWTLCASLAAAETRVASFSPEGEVKRVRQVTARFSQPMVAFGDPRAPDPFMVDCAPAGKGRWVDASTWSYDFETDLPGAAACRFTLREDSRDLAGQPLAGQRRFGFTTGGPAVLRSLPYNGDGGIDEHQVFVLALDAPARRDSIERAAWCRAEGINEKIPLRVLEGEERARIVALRREFVDRHLAAWAKANGRTWRAGAALDTLGAALPLAVAQCRRTLPANQKIALVWGKGIAAPNGVATSADQHLDFRTRPDFTVFAGCDRVNARAGCVPFLPVRVRFSAPVALKDAQAIALEGPGGKRFLPDIGKDEMKRGFVDSLSFPGPFPERSDLRLLLPPGLKDDAGRTLVLPAKAKLALRTDRQPPLVKFAAPFGIIEAKGDRMLPVTVRNVEAALATAVRSSGASLRVRGDEDVIAWMRRLNGSRNADWEPHDQSGASLARPVLGKNAGGEIERFALPRPNGRRAFEVIGIPLRKPGFYVVEVSSPQLGAAINQKGKTAYVHAGALVTNLAAHFKHGAQSSLVWVTSLDKGRPVARADVAVRNCAGKLLWSGRTDASGIARIGAELIASHCRGGGGFFVSARSGEDFTFTLSDWQRGIESWRFNLPTSSVDQDSRLVATVFDRSLLRAGETVHMKHFLRRRTTKGIALVRAGDKPPRSVPGWPVEEAAEDKAPLPAKGWLVHTGSGDKTAFALRWEGGASLGEWKIPVEAKLGQYQVVIGGQIAGSFRVEQFRVPTMKAVLKGPDTPLVAPRSVTIDAQVNYLSGGPAGLAPVKLRTVLGDAYIHFDDFEGFSFAAGDVKEGVEREGTGEEGGYWDGDEEGVEDQGEGGRQGAEAARTQTLALDRNGGARIVVPDLPELDRPRSLLAELSYQDANGETLTASTRAPLWPSHLVVGIKTGGWIAGQDIKFQVAVVDVRGKPVADSQVEVDLFERVSYAHRRRLVGGFYAYENTSEVRRVGQACSGRTDAGGLLACSLKAPTQGNLLLRARSVDADGRPAVTQASIWVGGEEDGWFEASDNDRIDLLPAKPRYEPGEEATFQVRAPFRAGTILVTVEREGILDTYVRRFSGKEPTVTIPMKAHYAPNVYVSAMVVRGRVAGVQPTALVDLGKPAYKLGIAQVPVGWAAHELKVQVAADRQVYRVREQAGVRVKVTRADGKALPAGAEVALAAVDAGLLELMPNESWKLLEAMMRQRSLQVQTSTAQMQVVGKRHFGRKAVAHGGGGGRGASRELFETLLLWQGKVKLDANGEAALPVPLNDSLTSFRIVAVASAGAALFGTGSTEIRTTQDLMLMSGLPQLVREGDRLRAGFTLRNASARSLQVRLNASVGADGGAAPSLTAQSVTLEPGAAREVGWDYQVPQAQSLRWQVEARMEGASEGANDSLRVTQKVGAAVPVRTLQATLLQLDAPKTMQVARPPDALPGHGGVRTTFSDRLAGSMAGVRDYMRAYPYTCFEQLTSRAVALRDEKMWQGLAATLPAHLDDDGLLKYFASMDHGSDSLTAYVLSVTHEAGYDIDEEARARMEDGLVAFVEGRVTRGGSLRSGELAVRKLAALEALSRSRDVREEWLQSIRIEPDLWPTSAVIDWYMVLRRAPGLGEHAARLAQAERVLRSRLNLQGTSMGFSTERSDDWWWLMATPDGNANRLLLAMLDNPAWQGDMGRLARGALGRQQRGHWDTTLANAWGVLAMEKFSNQFEATPVSGKSVAILSGSGTSASWSGTVPAATLQGWPQSGSGQLTLRHEGAGKPWATVQSLAAVPLKAPLSAGYRIVRSVTPVEQAKQGVWMRGDVYRVKLTIDAQADMNWVVVDDPIPASASILGTGLGRDSGIATSGERQRGWVWPEFEERTQGAFRAYYSFVPKGQWSIEYTVRLNNAGSFSLPPTRVEAMYNPEMFGELPNAAVVVGR
ncbi:MAG: alpha-2-macroglobulin family protein [Pseudomonadota bacterium]